MFTRKSTKQNSDKIINEVKRIPIATKKTNKTNNKEKGVDKKLIKQISAQGF